MKKINWKTKGLKLKNQFQVKKLVYFPLFDIFLFTLLLYLKYVFFFEQTSIEDELFFTRKGQIFTVVTLLLIASIFSFLTSKKRKWTLLFIATLLSILMFIDTIYFRHFRDYTSFSLIYQVNQLGDIKGTIFELLHVQDFLYMLDLLIIAFLLIIYRRNRTQDKVKITATKVILYFTIWSIILFFNLYGAIDYAGATKHRNTNSMSSCQMGAINFHLLDTYDFISEKLTSPKLTEDKIKEIKDSFSAKPSDATLSSWGMLKGKNVLMIQMESMSEYVINQRIEGQEITPNLNRLAKENYYANNLYTQIADGHSSDAEFIALNSLFPLSKGSVSIMYGMNDYYALPEILSEQGYYTFSAHGFREEFWNRVNMHKSLGFQESNFANEFIITKKYGLGMTDEDFFAQSVEKIKTLPEPFFSFLITLQNHQPFDGRDKSFNVGKLEGTKMGKYMQSSHEADKAIGLLMEKMEASGLAENTLIVLYGDHDAEITTDEMKEIDPDVTVVDMNQFKRVPLLMIFPQHELVKVDNQPLGQIDIMPSVLHLLGIEPKPNLMYGENIFAYKKDKTVGTIQKKHIGMDYIFGNENDSLDKAKALDLESEEEREITDTMIKADEMYEEQANNSDLLIRTNGLKELLNKE